MIRRYIFLVMFILTADVTAHAVDARVSVIEVKDTRSTGQFFNNMEIKLKLTGDDVADAKGIRTVITSAVDDTGRNLLEEEKSAEFKSSQDGGLGPVVDLKFKNPARKASVVKEISGEVQLFMPERDSASTVMLKNFKTLTGKPVIDPVLAQAGIRLTVLSKKEYQTLAKQKEQQATQEAEKKNLGQAMVQAFEGMLGAFFQVGENDVLLQMVDPSEKFINVEVLNGKGAVIHTTSTTYADDMRVLGFAQALPADAQLRIFLKTPKSVVMIPFKLVDIALP